jgi:hypothetical protein
MGFFMAQNKRDSSMIDLFSRDKGGHEYLWATLHECALEHHQEIMKEIEGGGEVAIILTKKAEYDAMYDIAINAGPHC